MLGFLKNSGIYFDTRPKEGSKNAVTSDGIFKAIQEGGGGGGTSDYTMLTNKPKINNVELLGNKSLVSLGIASRADLTTVEDNITSINADIIELENNKADVSDIPDISGLATKLELQSTNDRMTQAETDIDTLETAVSEKATTASVTALAGRVTQAETDIDELKNGGYRTPAGIISPYAGNTAPTGWLLCQGQAVSRTTYSELFAVIGTSYGDGDGNTTFNVPDLQETVPVGIGQRASGVTEHDTYTLGQFKDDQLQGHEHSYYRPSSGYLISGINGTNAGGATGTTLSIQADSTHGIPRIGSTTHGKQLGVNYIIKT